MLFPKLKEINDNLNSKPDSRRTLGIILSVIIIGLFFTFIGLQAIYLNAGMVALSRELWGNPSYLKGEEILSRYLDRYPEDRDVWEGLGSYWFFSGENGQAVEAWRQAGLTSWDLIQKGVYLQRSGKIEEAILWYEAAVEIDPGIGDASYFLGWMYALKGNQDLAWGYLIQADDYL